MTIFHKNFKDPLFLAPVLTINLIFDPREKTDWPRQKSNQHSGETESSSTKLLENYGEHPEESTGVFDRPADKIAGFRQKNNSP